MAFDATAVYAGRSMIAYQAPFATSNAPPALTVAYGTAWSSPWVDCGYTQDGVEWEISHDYADIMVDQELSAVLTVPSGQNVAVRTNMAEFTMPHLLVGVGQGTVTPTVGATGVHSVTTYALTSNISDQLYSFGMDFKKPSNGEALRIFLWKGRPIASWTTKFGVSDSNPQVPIEMRAYPDTSVSPARYLTIQDIAPVTP